MASRTKSTSKPTKTKTKTKSSSRSSGGFGLNKFIEIAKKHAIPAAVAVAVVAFASGFAPNKDGQKFNLTRTAVAGLIPVVAGKILKKKLKPEFVERVMTWAIGLSLIWDGARATLMQFGFLKTAIEKAEEYGGKVSIGKKQTGTQGTIIRDGVGNTRRMPSQTGAPGPNRGTGDVFQGYRGPEVTDDVVNFQRV